MPILKTWFTWAVDCLLIITAILSFYGMFKIISVNNLPAAEEDLL